MRIRELTLRNYRGYAERPKFEFSDRFTAVAGINGRGKTALLDGLALLCSRFLPFVTSVPSGYRTITPSEGASRHGVSRTGHEGQLRWDSNRIQAHLRQGAPRVKTTRLSAAVKREVKDAYRNPTHVNGGAPLAIYYTTDRAGYRLPKKLPTEVAARPSSRALGSAHQSHRELSRLHARYLSAVTVERTERANNPNILGDRGVVAISRAVTTFLGGFKNLRVQEEPLRLLVDKAGRALDLSQLSDGERSFLALICDLGRRLALANPRLDKPLHGAGVVLIDELELHLHPRWQREVSEKLRKTFPNIQFITTTHSPFVIQALRPGELINLDPDEFGEYADKSIEDISETVMGVDLPQKSKRYWEMMRAAEDYFRLLRADGENAAELAAAEQRLGEVSVRFSNDPAFQALLKLEREAASGGGGDATR